MSSEALPLTSTPKGVVKKCATKLTLIYARVPRLKSSVITNLIVFSEYGMTNSKNLMCGFTSDSNPKRVKRDNKIGIYLYKRTKVKITGKEYFRLPRIRTAMPAS